MASTGLAGRAFGSWQYLVESMWLRDFLIDDIKGIRTFIWGQDSKLEDSLSHITIENLRDAFIDELVKT